MIYLIGLILCGGLVYLDQYTKWLAATQLRRPYGPGYREFIPNILGFEFHTNTGAAFGILDGWRWFFLAITLLIVTLIIFFYIKLPKNRVSNITRIFMAVLAAGALGNGIDRLLHGEVVDFLKIEFMNFPIFNLADVYVVISTIVLAVLLIFFFREEPKKG